MPTMPFDAWLALREPADAAARSPELVAEVQASLPRGRRVVVHDLGCGTGSMARWLAPLLPVPQHWVMHDRDADLLGLAAERPPLGERVTVEVRRRDITRLANDELAGADLVTASALLDMFTAAELERFVAVCVGAGCPTLVSLSVVGRVELDPAHRLDGVLADAFNAHQRRPTSGGALLGPDAAGAAAKAFTEAGMRVTTRPSPWRLDGSHGALAAEWFRGWMGAALEQQPALADEAAPYGRRRLAEAHAGRLTVTVHHQDMLVRPW